MRQDSQKKNVDVDKQRVDKDEYREYTKNTQVDLVVFVQFHDCIVRISQRLSSN